MTTSPQRHLPFGEAFRFWLHLGFISFGGPAGQIAIMHRELVERRRWIGEKRFLHALNYCMLLPGPEATQLAIYIGWLLHRLPGGIIAGVFFVLPSIFLMLVLSYVYMAFGALPAVAAIFSGVKPVVVAIVIDALLRIGRRALGRPMHYVIAAAAFVAIYFLHVPFPLIVLGAGLIGTLGARFRPELLVKPPDGPLPGLADGPTSNDPARPSPVIPVLIDDDAPTPPHALPSRKRAVRTVAIGLVLWAVPFLLVVATLGPRSLPAREYRFFTQAALVTFGGAYAVLAYVTQAAVDSYAWMTHAQALDGLALAETTPGPLIMVLQFIGFVAAWNHPESIGPTASAVIGALVTTWTMFLPCFVFIFLGAPYIEVLRGNRFLSGALSGVTASVVGVILNLALVFGVAVIRSDASAATPGGVDWFAASITLVAFATLYRWRSPVHWIVLAGGLIGLARLLLPFNMR